MILALAGVPVTEIRFTLPHKDWQPSFIMYQLEQNEITNPENDLTKDDQADALVKQLKEANHHYERRMIWRRHFKQQI
jgi:hypothetical protein